MGYRTDSEQCLDFSAVDGGTLVNIGENLISRSDTLSADFMERVKALVPDDRIHPSTVNEIAALLPENQGGESGDFLMALLLITALGVDKEDRSEASLYARAFKPDTSPAADIVVWGKNDTGRSRFDRKALLASSQILDLLRTGEIPHSSNLNPRRVSNRTDLKTFLLGKNGEGRWACDPIS